MATLSGPAVSQAEPTPGDPPGAALESRGHKTPRLRRLSPAQSQQSPGLTRHPELLPELIPARSQSLSAWYCDRL